MADRKTTSLLQMYAQNIRKQRQANPNVPETALAPQFQQLIENILPLLPAVPTLTVSPEFNKAGVGRPDIALIRQGQPPRAFIELKAPAKSADPERWKDAHDKRQYERLKELGTWATSNFTGFHLFNRDAEAGEAIIAPAKALNPDTPDKAADKLIAEHDIQPFLDLLATLARADAPAARSAKHLAELMAHSARLVRSAVQERVGELGVEGNANHPLMLVRNTFRNVLYAHPEAGGYAAADFDTLFSSAFAQTLAFGLLLVRESIQDDAAITDKTVGLDAWEHMPDEHPLMKAALEVLSNRKVVAEIGIGFDVMCDTVNSFAPEILALQKDGRDPILYFYEDFLEIFDPAARDKYGVYYTPIEVVRYMTGALDRALRDNLGTQGLRDPDVTILDPATGTGTFLLGVAERVRDQVMADEGGKAASSALRGLAGRMYGFELLVGPYAVAHYRLHHALRYRPPDDDEEEPQPVKLPRLGVYLADTLSNPETDAPMGGLGIQGIPIAEERAEANRIKATQPILAIIGNPPYRRLRDGEVDHLVGRWMNDVWDDLKRPVSEAGWGNDLATFPELSVAFWRWSMWKIFEADNAPNKGIVAFISNRKFLTGRPYAGFRKSLRERFDRIEIVDLRGDIRRGERAGVANDVGVFNIQVGTSITLAVADGSKAVGALAEVIYSDAWTGAYFSRRSKLEWLTQNSENGFASESVIVSRSALEDMRPKPFQNGEWLSVQSAFAYKQSGVKSQHDDDLVRVISAGFSESIPPLIAHRDVKAIDPALARKVAYRPFDNRFLYNDPGLVKRRRPDLQLAWANENLCLYSLPAGTGAGPSVWCHGLLPDYHSFRGSYGGYAFPLYDRRIGPDATNIAPVLIASLAEAYGQPVAPQDIFDAILCLLSATSYTHRFAEDLEDVFPHIPFPATHEVFQRAAAIGREIRGLESFGRTTAAAFRP
ncbi:MAG: type ISP restriction/modification enzyme [Sphingomonadaceae bacterium]